MPNLLIIDTEDFNWPKLFEDTENITVEQAQWKDLEVTSYSDSGVYVDLFPADKPLAGTKQYDKRVFKTDFVLVRNVVKEPHPSRNFTSKLLGLMHGHLPAVNSLFSIYSCLERPIVYGALQQLAQKLGKENFPVIDQTFYSNFSTAIITPPFPNVVKVGHSHSSYGKMMLQNNEEFRDLVSVIALHDDYFSAEEFIESSYELRIQKIGPHYRTFKRTSFDWKINRTTPLIEDIELEPRYKLWVDECASLFGGLDILALDVLVTPDDKEIILELNDTAAGMNYKKEEDYPLIKELVTKKMNSLYNK